MNTLRKICLVGLLLTVLPGVVSAEPRHGLSAFGDLKYPADFAHFDYVNPDAPKGGRIVTMGTGGLTTFDSLNGYILKGDSAQLIGLLFDSLMVGSGDEPDSVYGLVAESADLAADGRSVEFKLRPQARFSDGSPLTADDVVYSFYLLKEKGHPGIALTLGNVDKAVALSPGLVRFEFSGDNIRDLPMTVASLPIFSKAYYSKVEFAKTTLEPPLGSGPYLVRELKQGSFITYGLREDYWAKDLPVNVGRHNFGEIKLLYFRDRTAQLEALKAGVLDLREEFTSKHWATEYNIEAVKDGRLIKAQLPDETTSGAQGFFINMRREKFRDIRTRQALALAFDFEWSNANLFYGLYKRTSGFFENSVSKAVGPPSETQLKLLSPLKGKIPEAAFQEAILPPVSDGSGQDRKLLRKANQLLRAAGWKRQGTQLVNAKGQPFTIEFLTFSPSFERIIAPYVRNLKLLGITATIRQVEAAQYQERVKRFDFDLTTRRFVMSETPGVELESYFSSKVADMNGSYNLSGLKSEGVDALVSNAMQAKSRAELVASVAALDRVLRAYYLWVPHWYKGAHNVVHWDIFGRPARKPRFARGILDTWWIDAKKAASIQRGS